MSSTKEGGKIRASEKLVGKVAIAVIVLSAIAQTWRCVTLERTYVQISLPDECSVRHPRLIEMTATGGVIVYLQPGERLLKFHCGEEVHTVSIKVPRFEQYIGFDPAEVGEVICVGYEEGVEETLYIPREASD
jgi:hypothetical protein